MDLSRRAFVRSVGLGGAGALSTAFIIARGREELAASGLETVQNPPMVPPGFIRISGNENPRGPGHSALAALDSRVTPGVGRYPDNPPDLADTIGEMYGTDSDHVLVSTGSAGLLAAAVRAFTSPTQALVNGSPSYGAPVGTARRIGTPVKEVPVKANLELDLDGMVEAAQGAGLVFLCNPNNPTSTFYSLDQVANFISRVRSSSPNTMIHVDEAYIDYADHFGETAIPLSLRDSHVFVTRTFSKAYGMAGLRLGYAIGQPRTLQAMNNVWGLGSVNSFTAAAAIASLGDPEHMVRERAENKRVRDYTLKTFKDLGVQAPASQTNFLFINLGHPANVFRTACLQHNVQVGRDFPPLENTHCRVSIGTMEEMEVAAGVFKSVLKA